MSVSMILLDNMKEHAIRLASCLQTQQKLFQFLHRFSMFKLKYQEIFQYENDVDTKMISDSFICLPVSISSIDIFEYYSSILFQHSLQQCNRRNQWQYAFILFDDIFTDLLRKINDFEDFDIFYANILIEDMKSILFTKSITHQVFISTLHFYYVCNIKIKYLLMISHFLNRHNEYIELIKQ